MEGKLLRKAKRDNGHPANLDFLHLGHELGRDARPAEARHLLETAPRVDTHKARHDRRIDSPVGWREISADVTGTRIRTDALNKLLDKLLSPEPSLRRAGYELQVVTFTLLACMSKNLLSHLQRVIHVFVGDKVKQRGRLAAAPILACQYSTTAPYSTHRSWHAFM